MKRTFDFASGTYTAIDGIYRGCAVCGVHNPQAHAEHDVCTACVDDPQAVRRRHDELRQSYCDAHQAAIARYEQARAALTPDEAERWNAFGAAWILDRAGEADPGTSRRVAATLAALEDRTDARFSPALRRAYDAWHHEMWAQRAVYQHCRTLDIQLATLSICLEALGRQGEADALYEVTE